MTRNDPLDLLDQDERSLLRTRTGSGWFEPELATLTDNRFSEPGWLFERKLDGVRTLSAHRDGEVTVWSRNRKTMNDTYPELVDAFSAAGSADFVVDGEIVAFEGSQTSFARLQPRINLTDRSRIEHTGIPVVCYVFDLLALGDKDLTRLPLRTRKRLLSKAFDFTDPLRYSTHRNTDGEAYYKEACTNGWEGLIAKRADAPYRGGRSTDWLKFKCVAEQEFVVGGFTEPRGTRNGLGALLVGYYRGDELRYAGKVGTGYTEQTLRLLRDRLDSLEQMTSPFAEQVKEPDTHWVRPELVAQIGFTEWTDAARLRHPRYLGLRQDKSARDIVREQ